MNYTLDILVSCKKNKLKEILQQDIECITFIISFIDPEFDKLERLLAKYNMTESFWHTYLFSNTEINEEAIRYLISKDICNEELAHLDLDDYWLLQLGEKYAEAFQTLWIRYYTKGTAGYKSKNCGDQEFREFIDAIYSTPLSRWLHEDYIKEWIKKLVPDIELKREIAESAISIY